MRLSLFKILFFFLCCIQTFGWKFFCVLNSYRIIIYSQPQSYVFITVLQRRPKLDGNILKQKEKKINNICTLTVVLADRQCASYSLEWSSHMLLFSVQRFVPCCWLLSLFRYSCCFWFILFSNSNLKHF
jgi:hypothetical protein